jgi:hypothetical protein
MGSSPQDDGGRSRGTRPIIADHNMVQGPSFLVALCSVTSLKHIQLLPEGHSIMDDKVQLFKLICALGHYRWVRFSCTLRVVLTEHGVYEAPSLGNHRKLRWPSSGTRLWWCELVLPARGQGSSFGTSVGEQRRLGAGLKRASEGPLLSSWAGQFAIVLIHR